MKTVEKKENWGRKAYILHLEIFIMIPTAKSHENIHAMCGRRSTEKHLWALSSGQKFKKGFGYLQIHKGKSYWAFGVSEAKDLGKEKALNINKKKLLP